MEAQSTDSLTACLSKVMESDIYVLILGSRYGWQPEGKESVTELEYQTARIKKYSCLGNQYYLSKRTITKGF